MTVSYPARNDTSDTSHKKRTNFANEGSLAGQALCVVPRGIGQVHLNAVLLLDVVRFSGVPQRVEERALALGPEDTGAVNPLVGALFVNVVATEPNLVDTRVGLVDKADDVVVALLRVDRDEVAAVLFANGLRLWPGPRLVEEDELARSRCKKGQSGTCIGALRIQQRGSESRRTIKNRAGRVLTEAKHRDNL